MTDRHVFFTVVVILGCAVVIRLNAPEGSDRIALAPDELSLQTSTFASLSPEPDPTLVEAALLPGPLEKEPPAERIFPSTPLGDALKTIVELNGVGSETSAKGDQLASALAFAELNPDESIKAITAAMDDSSLDEETRRFLLQFGAKLNADKDAKIEMIRKNLARVRDPEYAKQASPFSLAISFETLMDVTEDPAILKTELDALMKVYGGTEPGDALMLRYASRFPAQAKHHADERD